MRILQTFTAPPEPCPYLAGERWRLQYERLGELYPDEYDARLENGWFKYGHHLQRPACESCRECQSMRVPVDEFQPNRAQRRVLAKNADLEVRFVSPPPVDHARVLLHNHYRASQIVERGWPFLGWDLETYRHEFAACPLTMTEISVWEGRRLRAVVLADVAEESVAGVTHYYDPVLRERSIGLFVMLQTFELARQLQKKWLYLGYYVPDSPTMGYKIQFRPAELRTWDGEWQRIER